MKKVGCALLPLFALTACGGGDSGEQQTYQQAAENGYSQPSEKQTASVPDQITVETLRSGNFASMLPDGFHRVTIDGEILGQDEDGTCVVLKDSAAAFRTGYGYLGMSCDFN